MTEATTPTRKIVKSYTFELGILERFEEQIPKGQRSFFLNTILSREIERSASLDQLVKEYDQRTVRAQVSTVG